MRLDLVTDYKVLYGANPEDLSEEVRLSIGEGWIPLKGGFSVTVYQYRDRDGEEQTGENFYQAVIKRFEYLPSLDDEPEG